MDYLELIVEIEPRDPWSEILIAQLAESGFESFVDTENGIMAYAQISDVDVDNLLKDTFLDKRQLDTNQPLSFNFDWRYNIIPKQNWNEAWEKEFHPVHVGDLLTIYAPFHDKKCIKGMGVEILPKMSFGTGHHQTTFLMSKGLFDLIPFPQNVLDMGTGTGVLAIVSEKLGAQKIVAVDIETWSVENTIENAHRNNCQNIEAHCGDVDILTGSYYDLILANINKNVLTRHLPFYADMLKQGGQLFLSGFFTTDADELLLLAKKYNFKLDAMESLETWAFLKLIKN